MFQVWQITSIMCKRFCLLDKDICHCHSQKQDLASVNLKLWITFACIKIECSSRVKLQELGEKKSAKCFPDKTSISSIPVVSTMGFKDLRQRFTGKLTSPWGSVNVTLLNFLVFKINLKSTETNGAWLK